MLHSHRLTTPTRNVLATPCILSCRPINTIVVEKDKIISQSYDGASVMRGEHKGVQKLVKDRFPFAHYVHCYAHQLNLILSNVSSIITKVRIFFANLSAFSSFFSMSPKRTAVLQSLATSRLPRPSATRWNFRSRLVNTVFEKWRALIECFTVISERTDFDNVSLHSAIGLRKLLCDDAKSLCFSFFFNALMMHVDILSAQLQRKDSDPVSVRNNTVDFSRAIEVLRSNIHDIWTRLHDEIVFEPVYRESESCKSNCLSAAEKVCELTIAECKKRFDFCAHLSAAQLVSSARFADFNRFPENYRYLDETVESYPFLKKEKLRSELKVLYERPDLQKSSGTMGIFNFIVRISGLEKCFSETCTLLQIILTIPMSTAEAERCFSTLKRVKTFLRNSMADSRMNALAMLSIEKDMIRHTSDFNEKVINVFQTLKERRAEFSNK